MLYASAAPGPAKPTASTSTTIPRKLSELNANINNTLNVRARFKVAQQLLLTNTITCKCISNKCLANTHCSLAPNQIQPELEQKPETSFCIYNTRVYCDYLYTHPYAPMAIYPYTYRPVS